MGDQIIEQLKENLTSEKLISILNEDPVLKERGLEITEIGRIIDTSGNKPEQSATLFSVLIKRGEEIKEIAEFYVEQYPGKEIYIVMGTRSIIWHLFDEDMQDFQTAET